MRGMEHCFFYV